MVKRGDLLKIFFIYLCLCHVVPVHPCDDNPLDRFRPFATMLGTDVKHLMGILREANLNLYNQVHAEWQVYADCVGLVETGYFKRSGGSSPAIEEVSSSSLSSSSGAGVGDQDDIFMFKK